ncbi:hypothetical protein PG994_008468 [Apiospora phragmitis]|uniref:Secreted protein n=1 Tax=Apiospora phragmitis TaxID=2905665 RepID=A0ABR1UGI2_9PEZI
MLTTEVIVALVLGVPALLVAAAALWIAYLTYAFSRESHSSLLAAHVPLWPAHYPSLFPDAGSWASSPRLSSVSADGLPVPPPAFPGPLRRRVNR